MPDYNVRLYNANFLNFTELFGCNFIKFLAIPRPVLVVHHDVHQSNNSDVFKSSTEKFHTRNVHDSNKLVACIRTFFDQKTFFEKSKTGQLTDTALFMNLKNLILKNLGCKCFHRRSGRLSNESHMNSVRNSKQIRPTDVI